MKAAAKIKPSVELGAGDFKARCLAVLDEVKTEKKRFTITKRGQPYADIIPHETPKPPFRSVIGRTPNIQISGEIVTGTGEEWTAKEWPWK